MRITLSYTLKSINIRVAMIPKYQAKYLGLKGLYRKFLIPFWDTFFHQKNMQKSWILKTKSKVWFTTKPNA